MSAVERFCHRAMLLDTRATSSAIGEPDEVAHRYLRLELREAGRPEHEAQPVAPEGIRAAVGRRVDRVRRRAHRQHRAAASELDFPRRASRRRAEIPGPSFGFMITNADGVEVGGFGRRHRRRRRACRPCSRPASALHIKAKIDNHFAAGPLRIIVRAFAITRSPSR